MSWITLTNAYAGASLAFLAALPLLAALRALNARLRVPLKQRHLLVVGYCLCVAALLAPALAAGLPQRASLLPPAVQIWSGTSMRAVASRPRGAESTAVASAAPSIPSPFVALAALALLAGGVALMFVRLARELRRANHLVGSAALLRRRGSASVLVSDALDMPCSFWLPGHSVVLVPGHWLLRPADLRMALRHEAQHHRQLDTRLLHVLQLLRALFWWHPAVHALVRQVLELQEFACDEAVASRGVGREAYCRCLLSAAETALRAPPLAVAGMMGVSRGALLRRVQAMMHPPALHRGRGAAAVVTLLATLVLGGMAVAAATPIHDRRVTLADAERMAASVRRAGSTFPVVVNTPVLAQLNALLGTPDGRAFLRASVQRMAVHRSFIEGELARYGLPRELLAVPLVESGYRNRVAGIGGGLWMFIEPTARRFGLQVSRARDDRLDTALETDAAMRMLAGLHQQFDDWPLALLAYNTGNAHVEQAIQERSSRDAFALIGEHGEDAVYLPRVMAAVLVLANPAVLD